MDYSNLQQSIAAYRSEVETNSVSPESTGYLLNCIVNFIKSLDETFSSTDESLRSAMEQMTSNIGNITTSLEGFLSQSYPSTINEINYNINNLLAASRNLSELLSNHRNEWEGFRTQTYPTAINELEYRIRSLTIPKMETVTKTEYDAMEQPEEDVFYFVFEEL